MIGSARIVVLGGGIGGQVAANELRRRLPPPHTVTIVERTPTHAFAPSFLWVMAGSRRPAQITRPLRSLVGDGVDLVQAEVTGIDAAGRSVETSAGRLPFDFLVVALGAELAPEAVPGLPAAHTCYTLDGAERLHAALRSFEGGRIAITIAGLPYKCPAAPHEAAMLIADVFRQRGMRDRVQVDVFSPEGQPMPVAGPELGAAVRHVLEERSIGFHPLHRLLSVDPEQRQLRFDGRAPEPYDLLVAVPPHRAPALLRATGLVNDAGWMPVDPHTLRTAVDGVFAIGDVTALPIPGRWSPDVPLMLPKAGVFAHAQALAVAHRIAAIVRGEEPTAVFCGDGFCMLEAGAEAAGVAYGDFFATPAPQVQVRDVGRAWHLGKVLFEQWWLSPIGGRRTLLGAALKLGARAYGVPMPA